MKHVHRTLRTHLILIALSFILPSSLLAGNEYQIDLTIDPVKGKIHGIEKIAYKNETEAPLDTLTLDAPGLPGNPPVSGNERWRIFALVDVKGNNVPLTWRGEMEAYTAPLSPPLGAGFKTNLTLEYERPLSPDESAAGYLSLPDRGTGVWYLKFRAYRTGSFGSDDFKDVTVNLSLPAGWIAASTGTPPVKARGAAAGKVTLSAKAVRNFALAFSDKFRVEKGMAGTVSLAVYPLAGQEAWGKRALAETTEAVNYYASLLGGYPVSPIAVLPTAPGDAAGSSSNVIYAPATESDEILRDGIALEAARQVWGWTVGDPSDVTPFISNGLSIWCQQSFLAKKNGIDLHAQYLRSGINDVYLTGALRGYDTTLLRRREEIAKIDWDFARIVARAKSAAVMHMLANLVGEDKFLEVLKGLLKTSSRKVIGDRDFQAAAQAATTAKLEGFFDQWLRTKNTLDYYLSHVRAARTDAGFEAHVDVWKTGTAAMPVELITEGINGEKVRSTFPADRTSGEMVIPIKSALASVALDPRQILPMISRVGAKGRLDLAESLLAEGKLLRADEQIDMALGDSPQEPRALFLRGRVLKERGDWAGGLALWAKVMAPAPGPSSSSSADESAARVWAQIWTARLYDLQGKRSEAMALYTAVAALPDSWGSRAAAKTGLEKPFEDSWPPVVP